MYKYVISKLPSGQTVYLDLINSLAGEYVSRQPHVLTVIKEALPKIEFRTQKSFWVEHDMGRVVGNTDIVETTDKDNIYYAQGRKRQEFSRFAKNRLPESSAILTILVAQDDTGDYEVVDTWVGPNRPMFPGHIDESSASKEFWGNHALVNNAHPIQSNTITKNCPY